MTPAHKKARREVERLRNLLGSLEAELVLARDLADADQWRRRHAQVEQECAMLSYDLQRAVHELRSERTAARALGRRVIKLERQLKRKRKCR